MGKVRNAWRRRARQYLIKNVGKEDWCIFAKALCSSSGSCRGFPYDCISCFDAYFNSRDVLQNALKQ
ncbi:MAG: hypothetical protein NWF06_10540 [Candidatus Bathyarchaeota archaeon]|nr:hypothetical protein [Candidatus Bathyarchaeum sp.]